MSYLSRERPQPYNFDHKSVIETVLVDRPLIGILLLGLVCKPSFFAGMRIEEQTKNGWTPSYLGSLGFPWEIAGFCSYLTCSLITVLLGFPEIGRDLGFQE